MELLLEITGPEKHLLGDHARHTFAKAGGTLGRNADCDWYVPDSSRHLSSRHASVSFENGQFFITDISTNGTFLNSAEEPIGNGNSVPLGDGDQLTIGNYKIRCTLLRQSENAGADDRVLPSPYSPIHTSGAGTLPSFEPVNLFSKPDLLPFSSAPDHVAGHRQHFVPPTLLPEDWLDDEDETRISTPSLPAFDDTPDLSELSDHAAVDLPGTPAPPIVVASESEKFDTDLQWSENASPQSTLSLDAFWSALGIDPKNISHEQQQQWLDMAGRLLTVSFKGIIENMQARARLKNEFRMSMTLVKSAGNNPLKFAANEKQLIRHLALTENHLLNELPEAMQECFVSIAEHQRSVLQASQQALLHAFERLSPDRIEKKVDRTGGIAITSRSTRAWNAYKVFYHDMQTEEDVFSSVFGEAFRKAYEKLPTSENADSSSGLRLGNMDWE